MRLRPYIHDKDFDSIKNWMPEERAHAMWCANIIPYPMEKDGFAEVMSNAFDRFGDTPFVAISDAGEIEGFFLYSLNYETNEVLLKFVMVDPAKRGKGLGKEMLGLAVKYAFEISHADLVHLNVFPENAGAKKCYEGAGFVERDTTPEAFTYKDEKWGRTNMAIRKEAKSTKCDFLNGFSGYCE